MQLRMKPWHLRASGTVGGSLLLISFATACFQCSGDETTENTDAHAGAAGVADHGASAGMGGAAARQGGAAGAAATGVSGAVGVGGGGDAGPAGNGSSPEGGAAGASEPVVPAFPGALGWAAKTPGGRGGQIIRVTTLEADGTGSLLAALSTAGPRIIVFEVGGVIDLDKRELRVTQPFVTIAGQTAPSPGITLIRGGLRFTTHDVVVQHLRVRPGEAGAEKQSGWETDAISTNTGAYNVIIDHCSATWATDENLTASGERFQGETPDLWRIWTSHAVTFSYNIVAEGLSNSTHSEGEHSKGSLIHDNVTDVAVIGNLYFSNMDRHPLFKGGARGVVVNNYIANPGRDAVRYALNADEWTTNPYQTGQMAIVGNLLSYGPSSPADVPFLRITGAGPVEIFMEDNLVRTLDGDADPTTQDSAGNMIAVAKAPTWPEGLAAIPASKLGDFIRDNVGARPWDRDAIDARIVEEALSQQGAIIDSEAKVGGYPEHEPTSAPFDPNEWDLDTMTRKEP